MEQAMSDLDFLNDDFESDNFDHDYLYHQDAYEYYRGEFEYKDHCVDELDRDHDEPFEPDCDHDLDHLIDDGFDDHNENYDDVFEDRNPFWKRLTESYKFSIVLSI